MIKRFLIRFALRLLDRSFKLDYRKIDKAALENWAFRSYGDHGWNSYLAYTDLQILKEMSFGKDPEQYHILVGRRLQLLYLADEIKKGYENKKSKTQKAADENERKHRETENAGQ